MGSAHVLQHDFIETQICDEPFEPRVLIAQLVDFSKFRRAELAVLLFPKQDRIDVDASFAGDFLERNAGLNAAKNCRDRFG
jgi:hypothetical protein